jgi:hypothetical protein
MADHPPDLLAMPITALAYGNAAKHDGDPQAAAKAKAKLSAWATWMQGQSYKGLARIASAVMQLDPSNTDPDESAFRDLGDGLVDFMLDVRQRDPEFGESTEFKIHENNVRVLWSVK